MILNSTLNITTCAKCPTSRHLQCSDGRLDWEPATWYDPSIPSHEITADTEVWPCFNAESCRQVPLQGGGGSRIECADDLGYYGPLCGGCDIKRGFIRSGYVCSKCFPLLDNVLVVCVRHCSFFLLSPPPLSLVLCGVTLTPALPAPPHRRAT